MSKTSIAAIEAELADVRQRASALESALAALAGHAKHGAQPKPGDCMADGTVYVGISPTDERPLYAMPHDLEGLHTWDGAKTAATAQAFAGHTNWRVPTKEELDRLYRMQEAVGGFERDWYWSSSRSKRGNSNIAWAQQFNIGVQSLGPENSNERVRCVRSG